MYNPMLIIFLLTHLFVNVWRCQNASGAKTSEFLKQKFANYDKAVRPNFGGKLPVFYAHL